MATTKHMEIQTAGLVVVSQKLIRAAAADNSAKQLQYQEGHLYIFDYTDQVGSTTWEGSVRVLRLEMC